MEGHKWTGAQVRKTFLDFFAEKGHTIGIGKCMMWNFGFMLMAVV
jgi:alanyl-tRNA synthetase